MELWDEHKNKDKIISKLIITEVITVLNVKLKEDLEVIKHAYNYMNDNLIITNTDDDYDRAMEKIANYYPERIPFFDCVYIDIMENIEIEEIISFDKHFDNKERIIRIH